MGSISLKTADHMAQSLPETENARVRELLRTVLDSQDDTTALELIHDIGAANHLLRNLIGKQLGPEFSPAQFRMLAWLNAEEEVNHGGLLPSQLSQFQGIMPNTVSALIKSMRKQGLIEQVDHPQDGRKRIIRITDKGRDLLDREKDACAYMIKLLHGLSLEEQEIALTLIRKLIGTVKAQVETAEVSAP